MQGGKAGAAIQAAVQLFAVLGLAVLFLLWREGAAGISGASGVGLAVVTGWIGLWLKSRSLGAASHQAALGAMVGVFFLRLAVLVAGVVLVERWDGSLWDFVAGFFLAFLAAQIIEVRYLVASAKAAPPRSE